MNKIILQMEEFATFYHRNQLRKYSGEPYIVHPRAVAKRVTDIGGSVEMICAAWVHDALEDTQATLADIRDNFGHHISDFVYQITDIALPGTGNRKERTARNIQHLSGACASVKTIKICDILDNAPSIIRNDPEFAKVWLAEKRLLLPHLSQGNKILYKELYSLLNS